MANKNLLGLSVGSNTYNVRPYAACSTAAATAAKTATWDGFTLVEGATVLVKFSNANTVKNPTLNINSTGAKNIYYHGGALSDSKYYWSAGDIVEFVYDGTNWVLLNVGNTDTDTNTTYTAGTNVSISSNNVISATNTKVNVKLETTTKAYLLGVSTQPTSTEQALTAVSDTGVYLTTSSGELQATKMHASSGFFEDSDETLKDFGEAIPVDLEKLAKLRKSYFTWKADENKEIQIGISAQEVKEIYPEIVSTNAETGTLSVGYDKLAVIALAAIDKLNEKIESLEERLNKIEKNLNA